MSAERRDSIPFNTEGDLTQGEKVLQWDLSRNPHLKVFHTAEPWKLALIPDLIANGYITPIITGEGPIFAYNLTEKAYGLSKLPVPFPSRTE